MPDETMVVFGDAVKDLGNGKVGGYLVRFSDEKTPDIMGDFFTKDTDFGDHMTAPVLYAHGEDETLKGRVLGKAKLKKDDIGIWAEAQLELRDAYEHLVKWLVDTGKLGWSSGTAAHTIERTPVGKAMRIDRWYLGLDASLTPCPMEPRAVAVPLKAFVEMMGEGNSLKSLREASELAKSETKVQPEPIESAPTVPVDKRGESMSTEDLKQFEELLEKRFGSVDEAVKTLDKSVVALAKKFEEDGPGFIYEETEDEKVARKRPIKNTGPFKSIGEQLMAIKNYGQSGGRVIDDKLWKVADGLKALGMNEEILSEGGFLLQPTFAAELFKRTYETAAFASRCRVVSLGSGTNNLRINAIDEQSRVVGSRFGGIRMYWLAPGGSLTATKPALRQINLRLNKLVGAYYVTDEELADIPAMTSVVGDAFVEEAAFMLDEAVLFGQGAGQPLGIMNSPALVTVAKEAGQAAATVVTENIVKMWGRRWAKSGPNMVWYVHQDVEPSLDVMGLSVGVGGIPSYFPAGGISDMPYGRLKGRPVIVTENNQTLGTLGDVVLADMSQYFLAVKGGVDSAMSIHVAFLTDESIFRFIYRVDGQPIWNAPLTPAKGSNTFSPFVTLAARA